MTLFTKIMIGLYVLSIIGNIALIGQEKSVKKYTVSGALLSLFTGALMIYGLIFWI